MNNLIKLVTILTLITLSSIMISCNGDKTDGKNPLLDEWNTTFGMPPFETVKPQHYQPALEKMVAMHLQELEEIVDSKETPSFENTILAFDNSGKEYYKIATMFSLIYNANSNDELREVNRELAPIKSKHEDDIYMNSKLYHRVQQVYDNRESLGLDKLQIRLTEKLLQTLTLAGAHLSNADKKSLGKINEKLALIGIKFGDNVLKENQKFKMVVDSSGIAGLPHGAISAAAELAKQQGERGKFIFTLDKPSMLPFLSNSPNSELREELYKGYLDRANYDDDTDNKQVINDIVRLRIERANLLGYDSHAKYMLQERMAKSPEEVYSLLDQLWEPALNGAKKELVRMKEMKINETASDEFESWDWWYYAEKIRKNDYSLDESVVRQYFSLQNVTAGIFELSNRLFGMTFTPVLNSPVYHKDCVVYEVFDADNSHLGVLVMDFFPRAGAKKGGAWCGSYRTRTYDDAGVIATEPIVTIVCNFTEPVGNQPALLSLDEVETYFHEFGHAVHALLTDVPYRGLQRTERDFVELPSQLYENWAFTKDMLQRYATHYADNTIIPDRFINAIQKASTFNQGFATTEYLAASYSDMDIHTLTDYSEIDINQFELDVLNKKRGLISQIAPRYRYPYFLHIFSGGYSAGYYSYIWAEVLDKDAFAMFEESKDLFDPLIAMRYRKEILEKGGSADGMELYRNFRGKDPSREPLLRGRGLE